MRKVCKNGLMLAILGVMFMLCIATKSTAQNKPSETVPEGYIGIYDEEVPLKEISLNQSKVSLGSNKSLQLSVNYTPDNASDKMVEWTSGNQKKTADNVLAKGSILSMKNVSSRSIKIKFDNKGNADGYQVQYSLKENLKKSKKVKTKSTSATITKLKKHKKYYVRVRVYGKINGKTRYGKWSEKKSIKITAKALYTKRYKELEKKCKREINDETSSSYELMLASGKEFTLWDNELNYVYKRIYKELGAAQKKALKKSQRKWIKAKEKKADKEARGWGGSTYTAIYRSIVIEQTKKRIKWLIKKYA